MIGECQLIAFPGWALDALAAQLRDSGRKTQNVRGKHFKKYVLNICTYITRSVARQRGVATLRPSHNGRLRETRPFNNAAKGGTAGLRNSNSGKELYYLLSTLNYTDIAVTGGRWR